LNYKHVFRCVATKAEKDEYLLNAALSYAFLHRCYYDRHFCSFRISSLQEFASLIIELTGSNSTVRNLPHTEDDPKQRRPDISLAEREIGWKPMVSLSSATQTCRVASVIPYRQLGLPGLLNQTHSSSFSSLSCSVSQVSVRAGLALTIKYFLSELERNGGMIDSTGPFATKPQPVNRTP
jgi:hypothetical protein